MTQDVDSIESQILDLDGSCRDITFSDLNRAGASALLRIFGETFVLHIARDDEGISRNLNDALEYLSDAA